MSLISLAPKITATSVPSTWCSLSLKDYSNCTLAAGTACALRLNTRDCSHTFVPKKEQLFEISVRVFGKFILSTLIDCVPKTFYQKR